MADSFAGFSLARVGEVPVLWRADERFKTLRVSLCLQRPLDERAAARSLLPMLMLQGTSRDPDRPALAKRMERLYGASAAPVMQVLNATAFVGAIEVKPVVTDVPDIIIAPL